ncbi:hypothetical protein MKW98_013436 [Papaver atlanticum]|uniref:Mitochondrial import inner membrane translocase subunit Tim17/Tim22/Tim23 family protein n=1 Tax=Papaver atlanticum TaxID=357466 RepID=A0AAD4STZ5_9MAGN|nr:hypothetical protein MKW98_013436 [Papaver atlanticum]
MDVQGGGRAVLMRISNNQLQTISRKLTEFQMKLKELENGYRDWVSKQSFPVEDAVYIASNAIHGAAQGAVLGTLSQVASAHVFPQHSLSIKAIVRSPMAEARRFSSVQGIFAGLSCIIKRIRGKDDVQTRMAAGFLCGVAWRLEGKKMGDPYAVANAAILGVLCALLGGGLFKLDEKFSQPPSVEYTRTRCMLSNLGLENYEKNFKKGLLTDIITLPSLTDSVLNFKTWGFPP